MKKVKFFSVVIALAIVAICGCSNDSEEENSAENVSPVELSEETAKEILGSNYWNMESIEIPANVISISENVFSRSEYKLVKGAWWTWVTTSSNIKKITFQKGSRLRNINKEAFYKCKLESIELPEGLEKIDNYAFCNCPFKELKIPKSVTSIGEYAFRYCSSLSKIVIPNSVTSIGEYAFSSCTSLSEVEIPNSVISIEKSTFDHCSSLLKIVIPTSVTSIGHYAFRNCSNLSEVVIPNSVTSIGYEAFSDCSNLLEIVIPNSVTVIGIRAFYGCSNLKSAVFENQNWCGINNYGQHFEINPNIFESKEKTADWLKIDGHGLERL